MKETVFSKFGGLENTWERNGSREQAEAVSLKGEANALGLDHPSAMPGSWVSETSLNTQTAYSGKSPPVQS
jgi:hypothetical protein